LDLANFLLVACRYQEPPSTFRAKSEILRYLDANVFEWIAAAPSTRLTV